MLTKVGAYFTAFPDDHIRTAVGLPVLFFQWKIKVSQLGSFGSTKEFFSGPALQFLLVKISSLIKLNFVLAP
ncbi:MAG: hypothetical protein ACLFOZ_07590 [Cyclobacteriaceae bacterium]